MRTESQMAEFESESDASALLDAMGILAIVAAVPAYVLLLSLVASTVLPLYFLSPAATGASRIENRLDKGVRIFDDSTENKCKALSFLHNLN